MNNNPVTAASPETTIKTITIIHLALLAGQALFGIVAFINTQSTVINARPGNDVFFYIVPLLTIGSAVAGNFLYKQLIAKLTEKETVNAKLTGYQTALILRYALSEGPSLFGILIYMITGNLLYLIIVGLNILYFISLRPTKQKANDDLNLNYEDKIAMEN